LNGALVLETELKPVELMRALLGVEEGGWAEYVSGERERAAINQLGAGPLLRRPPRDRPMSRCMEIGCCVKLMLPHPAMAERRFVLEPLAEIAPDLGASVLGVTVRELFGWVEFLIRLIGCRNWGRMEEGIQSFCGSALHPAFGRVEPTHHARGSAR